MSEKTKTVLRQRPRIETVAAARGERTSPMSGVTGLVRRHDKTILSVLSVATFLIVWEMLPRLGLVKPLFTSSPSRIVVAAVALAQDGLWYDIGVTLTEFTLGFGLAVLIGIPFGVMLGWNRTMQAVFDPFVTMLYAVPRIALMPLIILWLGIGIESKVAVVFLGAIFPIVISVMSGVRLVDDTLVKCARVFGAADGQLLRTVIVPSSVPFMVTGMRLGAGRGLVGIVVGEMIAAQAGIGHMMARAGATFQTDKVFVGVILLALFGLALSQSLKALEARVESWRPQR